MRATGAKQRAARRSGAARRLPGVILTAKHLTIDELARSVETTDEWIVAAGARERHIAAGGGSDLALHGAGAANAHVEAN